MNLRPFATLTLLALATAPVRSQPAPPPSFEAADLHSSPRRSYPFFYAVVLPQGRYVVRDANMLNLIATAYGTNRENVQGGPSWLEMDRFDIVAKVSPSTPRSTLSLMLRNLLEQRFNLKASPATRPMPAYVLRVDKANLKLLPAAVAGEGKCEQHRSGSTVALSCHNTTMDDFAARIRGDAGDYLNKQVVNATSLDGTWDFELKWTVHGVLERAGADGSSLFAALDKLGLKLALETAPRPVLQVDSVAEKPTANAAGIDAVMPPLPVPQFEVATIKPSKPGTHGDGNIGFGKVDFKSITLRDMIDLAWDLNEENPEVIANAPKWLGEDRFDILAKVGSDSTGVSAGGDAGGLPMDIYEVQLMLRALLIERFQIKAHLEDRPVTAYTLVALNPKLKPSDPTVRTMCSEGPGPDGKDPRLVNPVQNRLVSCRDMSIPQLCDELRNVADGYIYNSIQDATGIKGSYDFTLSFSSADRLRAIAAPPANGESASDPSGAVSIFDAVSRQLGLKLEKQKRLLPVLVIDHIEEKPTEN